MTLEGELGADGEEGLVVSKDGDLTGGSCCDEGLSGVVDDLQAAIVSFEVVLPFGEEEDEGSEFPSLTAKLPVLLLEELSKLIVPAL